MEHTKGKWEIDSEELIRHNTGTCIAKTYAGSGDKHQHHILIEEQRANAHRIVACVNACEGIETEALGNMKNIKQVGFQIAVEKNRLQSRLDQSEKVKGELLEALRYVYDEGDTDWYPDLLEGARKAIKLAEEGSEE